ncbi:RodZ domain-containing protein [Pseudalkalibacillus sp. Hm43]|uniref:helix-turn-helix domain-containing protein n=1 Tax=Pseudalkalibacillus sp. Hm43 TaxID=3450742 RepID=UPI003F4263B2
MTELGQRLKEARLSKGLSYDELQDKTKIQKRYLQAIEEGQYSILPGAFYARAFIKNYAEAVDLDPDQLFEEHASDLPATDQAKTEFAPRASRAKSDVPKDSKIARVLPLIFTVMLLIALLIAGYWFVSNNVNNAKSEPTQDSVDDYDSEQGDEPEEPEQPAEDTQDDSSADDTTEGDSTETQSEEEEPVQEQNIEQVSTEGIVTTYTLSNTDEFNVELKTTGKSYIDVKGADNKLIQPSGKEYPEGETLQYSLTDQSKVTFNIGATPYVDITVNGEPFTYTVKPSERVHQKIVIQYEKGTENAQ